MNVELSYEEVVDTFFYAQPALGTIVRAAPRPGGCGTNGRGQRADYRIVGGCIDAGVNKGGDGGKAP